MIIILHSGTEEMAKLSPPKKLSKRSKADMELVIRNLWTEWITPEFVSEPDFVTWLIEKKGWKVPRENVFNIIVK
jgi:hypothetical protein